MRSFPLLISLCVAGCGYQGDTRPPSLKIPVTVKDLAVMERGSKIVVQFTVPTLTTEGLPLKDEPYLQLHIGEQKYHVPAPAKGPTAYFEADATPFFAQQVKVWVVAQNDHGRDSGSSNIVNFQVIPSLTVPAELDAKAVAEGVRLTWRSGDRQFAVYRKGLNDSALVRIGTADARTYTDETAQFGKPYEYAVQAINNGVESEMSATKKITPRDEFAPAVPTGLTALVGTQSVELVWDRNTESDLFGYRIFRDGKLLAESKDVPSFSDRTVEHGKRYRYTVSAYDQLKNESAQSETVEVQVP